ncbi:hypothetical protein [Mycobacteroides saopaulense]|uniref:DUF4190 domain-containing protein n=1 Tax=Mycobacteroides saopaulense TaxID=1578165 RepID=A0ABX3BWN1_9MYCO|nr:hypothetical protein [Mycobacteroides saopaulense]OHT81228.1 hypothetical protein BKG68_23610 [Mycobacteroides saopaulense]OHU07377.1 hypothetical protein BKG73_19215 [Mycobacteroides saopaulense]
MQDGPVAEYPSEPQKAPVTPWFGAISLALGVVALVLPLAPVDMTGWRPLACAIGLPGLVFGILGCFSRGKGKALAIAGVVLCVLALVMGIAMFARGELRKTPDRSKNLDQTAMVLRNDLNVHVGEVRGEGALSSVQVTLYNKGSDMATFYVEIQQQHDGKTCKALVGTEALLPAKTYEQTMYSCFGDDSLLISSTFKVVSARKTA